MHYFSPPPNPFSLSLFFFNILYDRLHAKQEKAWEEEKNPQLLDETWGPTEKVMRSQLAEDQEQQKHLDNRVQ